MDNNKVRYKNTNIGRPSPSSGCLSPNIERSDQEQILKKCLDRKFKKYRIVLGHLLKDMRKKRGLSQAALGAPSQIRRLERGEVAQICIMEILSWLVPCGREMLKILRNMVEHIPIQCSNCRRNCKYKGQDQHQLIKEYFDELTI